MDIRRLKVLSGMLVESEDYQEEIIYDEEFLPIANSVCRRMFPNTVFEVYIDDDGYIAIEDPEENCKIAIGLSNYENVSVLTGAWAFCSPEFKGLTGNIFKAGHDFLKKKHPDDRVILTVQNDTSDNYWPKLAQRLGIDYENNSW